MKNKLLVINLVGLTPAVLEQMPGLKSCFAEQSRRIPLVPPLPAVTCTSQATITTGSMPTEHGIVSNGWYFRDLADVRFWLRSDRLVQGEKLWDAARRLDPSIRVANLFWRYCTHATCDVTVTERPTYWANGRKGPDIYTSPGGTRDALVEKLGEFPLFRFWGPATSIESTEWIANATKQILQDESPDLALTYLPHLDYDLQKFGPNSPEASTAIQEVDQTTTKLIKASKELGYSIAVLSEYGMTGVSEPVYLNRVLREAGYLTVQRAKNGELLESGDSRAFAACSHQVAHVYVRDTKDLNSVRALLEKTPGVERVLGHAEKVEAGLDHDRAGELVAVAAPSSWFAYPYWLDDALAPDFARCVAIHDKPGHDPVEMFFGEGGKAKAMRRLLQTKMGLRVTMDVISIDAKKIRGSHGRPPENPDDGPVLLTDWVAECPDELHMTDVKSLLLKRLVPGSK